MNQTLEQFNSLITTLRMVENENEKLKPKVEALEAEEKAIRDDLKSAEDELSKSDQDNKAFVEDHKKAMKALDADLAKAKDECNQKQEEKDLYFELKALEKEIESLKENNEFLAHEIDDVRAGKLTPNFSKYLQSKVNKDEKQKLLAHFGKTITPERLGGVISMPTIEKIFDATILYYSRDHIIRVYEDRIERRKHINDVDKYLDIAVRQLNDFDNSVDAAQLELLEKVGITLDEFSSSIELYFTRGIQEIYLLSSMLPQKLKMFMPSRKRLRPEVVRDLLKYQKEILSVEFMILDILPKFKDDLTPDRVTTLLSNRLHDKVYEKFNVEEEDFMAAMQTSDCRNDEEIKSLLLDIRNAILENVPRTLQNTFGDESTVPIKKK